MSLTDEYNIVLWSLSHTGESKYSLVAHSTRATVSIVPVWPSVLLENCRSSKYTGSPKNMIIISAKEGNSSSCSMDELGSKNEDKEEKCYVSSFNSFFSRLSW